MTKIIHNRIKCKKCKQTIESHSRHDFVECKCGAVFVDGGHDYMRWGGKPEDIIDLSETKEVDSVWLTWIERHGMKWVQSVNKTRKASDQWVKKLQKLNPDCIIWNEEKEFYE